MNKNIKHVTVFSLGSLPVFTIASLVLLVLKLTAYPAIEWFLVIGVFMFPFLFLGAVIIGVLALILLIGICALIVDFFVGITDPWRN